MYNGNSPVPRQSKGSQFGGQGLCRFCLDLTYLNESVESEQLILPVVDETRLVEDTVFTKLCNIRRQAGAATQRLAIL